MATGDFGQWWRALESVQPSGEGEVHAVFPSAMRGIPVQLGQDSGMDFPDSSEAARRVGQRVAAVTESSQGITQQ